VGDEKCEVVGIGSTLAGECFGISTILCMWYQGGCNAFFDLGPQAKNVFWCEGFCWQENCECFFQD